MRLGGVNLNPILALVAIIWIGNHLLSRKSTQNADLETNSPVFDDFSYDVDLMNFDPRAKLELIFCDCGFTAIPWELEVTKHNEACPKCGTQCAAHSEKEQVVVFLGRDEQCRPVFRTFDPTSSRDRFDFNREAGRAMHKEMWNGLDWDQGGLERMRIDMLRMQGLSNTEAEDQVWKGVVPEL